MFRVLFVQNARQAASSSQNSILLHNLCRRICELPLWYLNANATILMKFALMAQAVQFTSHIEPIILLEASNLSPVWSSFAQLVNVCHVFFYSPEWYLLLETCHMIVKWCPILKNNMRKFLMILRHCCLHDFILHTQHKKARDIPMQSAQRQHMSHRNLAAKQIK